MTALPYQQIKTMKTLITLLITVILIGVAVAFFATNTNPITPKVEQVVDTTQEEIWNEWCVENPTKCKG